MSISGVHIERSMSEDFRVSPRRIARAFDQGGIATRHDLRKRKQISKADLHPSGCCGGKELT